MRSFAHTAGQITGAGACLEALRRTRSGQFDLAACVPLDALVADAEPAPRLIPMEGLLTDRPSVRLTAEGRERVTHGREIGMPHVDTSGQLDARAEAMLSAGARPVEADEWVRMLGPDGRLVAMATRGAAPGALHPSVVLI